MFKQIALVSLLVLAGCGLTPQGDFIRSTVATQGREAAAAALENTEWALCRAMPVGAILDRYGRSQEQADAWRTICRGSNDVQLMKPEE